jgi:cellulose synthase/poly-beta-1,6-N-acetylglucosamine synthase-like glycosyltransferase
VTSGSSTSVIVCTYNEGRLDLLRAALDGIAIQQPPCDELVVVVDHNPVLAERLRSERPDARIVESTGPKGLSGARNSGIDAAAGDVLVFLDDDAVPRAGWLAGLVAPFTDETVAAVGGRAEPAWEDGERPGWFPEELDWVVGCSFRGQQEGDVRNPIGCSMAVRASVLAEVGGFATELGRVGTLPVGCEETELGLRINGAGHRVVLVADTVVDHFVPRQRSTTRYVIARCYAEGQSKAVVRRLAGSETDGALDPERRYVLTLAQAMTRAVTEGARHRSATTLAQAALIPAAGLAGVAGFARARLRSTH